MRWNPMTRWLSSIILLAAIGGIAWSFAPDPAVSGALLHPAESVVYVAFDGGHLHDADFKKTAAYAALYESGLMDAFVKTADRLKNSAAGQIPDKERQRIAKALELGKLVLDKGLSISVVVQPSAGGPPTVSATVVANQAATFRAVVEQSLRDAFVTEPQIKVEPYRDGGKDLGITISGGNNDMGGTFTLLERSGHLVLNFATTASGQSPARDISFRALNSQGKNVSTHRLYKDAATERSFVQNGIAWIDFQPLKEMFGGIPLPPTRTGAQLTVKDILKELGLDSLEAIVTRSGFRDRATWSEASIIAPGPRTGLMSLLDQPTFTLEDLPPIAPKAASILASGIDAGAFYDQAVAAFKNISAKVEPQAIDQFDQALAQIESQIGFSIRNDFLAPLKGVVVISADGGGSQSFDSVLISMQMADAARFKSTLGKIFDMAAAVSNGEVAFEDVKKYGRDMWVMRIRQAPIVAPTICIDKKFAHIGIVPQAIDMALLRTDGKLPAWKPAGDTADALKLMPTKMTGFSYHDTPLMYNRLIGQAPLLLGFIQTGFAQADPGFEFPLKAEDLPPAELVSAPLFPNVAVSTIDQEGMKSYTRNSLPGTEMFVSTAGVGVLTALLLPAVQQAREAARRTTSRNNIKQIMLGIHNYEATFGHLPPGTMPNPKLPPEERLSWLAALQPYMGQAPLYNKMDQNAAWNQGVNESISKTVHPFYLNPSVSNPEPGTTHYVGLGGLGPEGPTLDAKNPKAGAFAYEKSRKFRDIIDGMSNTAFVIESNAGNHWMQGGSSTVKPLTQKPYLNGPDGIGGATAGGANVGMGDGSVRFLNEKIDPKVMEAITTIAGGEVIGVNDF